MKNALLFALGLLVIMSVAMFMIPASVLHGGIRGGSYATAGYTKCSTYAQCNDANPCTTDSCSKGVCVNVEYTGNAQGCSIKENGKACFNGEEVTRLSMPAVADGESVGVIGTNVEYAFFQEFGTNFLDGKYYLMKGLAKARSVIGKYAKKYFGEMRIK